MSNLNSIVRRAPKRFSAVVAMIAAAVIVPIAVLAYGPERPTFTGDSPAPYVTFNSITDNPDVGDERNFVRVRESGTGNYTDNVNLQSGGTYDVMVYYHNNAKTSLNASGVGIAHDVLLRMQMEANVAANSKTNVSGFITSSNANPGEVYDSASLTNTSAGTMDLSFVAGSAKVTSKGAVNGQTVPDSVFTTGSKLGYTALNGELPGCNEYAGYVIFKVKANQPNFTVTKQVRKTGETTWNKTEAVKAGDSIDYLVTYKNTGSTIQNNVVLKDTLPQGVAYTGHTTSVANTTNPQGLLLDAASDTATTTGANIGNYAPGAAAYVKFSATVAANANLPVCGANLLVNKAEIQTNNGNKSDTATVTVTKECTPPPVKITVCELATKKIVTIDEKDFDAKKYSKDLNDCKTIPPVKITVCELATKKIVTIDEKDFNTTKYSKNLKDCDTPTKITVCELATKKIISINEKDFDAKKYSKNLDDCKTVVPEQITVCELATKKIVTINKADFDESKYSADLAKCAQTPVTPPELPHTGASDNIVAVLGLGSIVAGVAYYIASRRALGL